MKLLKMSDSKYFGDKTHLTNSMMGYLSESPQHLRDYLDGKITKRSTAFDLGGLVHCMVLEPEEVEERFVIAPKFDLRKTSHLKDYTSFLMDYLKPEKKDFCESISSVRDRFYFVLDNIDVTPLCESHWERANYMCESIWANNQARLMIENATNLEDVCTWEERGVKCKCKMDIYNEGNYLADIKTTRIPMLDYFVNEASEKFGYKRQAAFYSSPVRVEEFYFIIVGKTEPYPCVIYPASAVYRMDGVKEYIPLLDLYKKHFID